MLAKKERSATSADYRYLLYLLILLSAHADRQGVDISFTVFVCVCVCLFVCMVTDFSAEDKASGVIFFVRRFIGVQGRESPISVNFAPPEAQNRTNRHGPRAIPFGR